MTRASLIVVFSIISWASGVRALEDYVNLIPNQVRTSDKPCITCHNNPNGGAGCGVGTAYPNDPLGRCWNTFGRDFSLNARVWNQALANMDSDGDGFTNGQELQDPTGTWRYLIRPAHPGTSACVTPPGDVDVEGVAADPGADADNDRYCCVGRDDNGDGDCRDSGEQTGSVGALTDCNQNDPQTHPDQPQTCVDSSLDNDCDGAAGMTDSDCSDLVDDDGDGFCEVGRLQGNVDRFCLLPAEQLAPGDCDDTRASVFPTGVEACFDGLDNNCDGALDLSDAACTGETARSDGDGDGYCSVGRDNNADGDCGDPGEDVSSDCNDSNAAVYPGATEECLDRLDNNCDGKPDLEDDYCATLVDRDADGYCPVGRDTSVPLDGDCADSGEGLLLSDCDDADPTSYPTARENCLDTADNDCDGAITLSDADCADFLDADGDGFCASGWDLDADGNCNTASEPNGPRDCNDDDLSVNPRAPEECTDSIDNDCDGRRDGSDSDCNMRVDSDHDGYCEAARDRNRDGDCTDVGEDVGPFDCAPRDGTVFPGAGENCFDDRDNDCNGLRDANDPQCTSAYDADGDGHCPIGRDINRDGDCRDIELDENVKESDCRDGDPTIHPMAVEDCFDWRDNNCDAHVDIADAECGGYLDHDGDSFCGHGKDLNGDGDCLDGGERTSGMDCEDGNPRVFPGSAEDCLDTLDNDCDGAPDLLDTECLCTSAALCDDGDPCTTDRCTTDQQRCENVALEGCPQTPEEDAGQDLDASSEMSDAAVRLPALHARGCDCHTVAGGTSSNGFVWVLFGLLFVRGLRRRRSLEET